MKLKHIKNYKGFIILTFLVILLSVVVLRAMGNTVVAGKSATPQIIILLILGIIEAFYFYLTFFHAKTQKKLEGKKKRAAKSKSKKVYDAIIDFQKATTIEEKTACLGNIEELGIKSPVYRQQCLEILSNEQKWMKGCKSYLQRKDIQQWRITGDNFDESYTISTAQQALSRNCLRIAESLIHAHVNSFVKGDTTLSLNFKVFPGLRLGGLIFEEGSVSFDHSIFWQTDFMKSSFDSISFKFTQLQKSKFMYARLVKVDMQQAMMKEVSLYTDLSGLVNFFVSQFMVAKDWHLNLLSDTQIESFFPTKDSSNQFWEIWNSKEYLRENLITQYHQTWDPVESE